VTQKQSDVDKILFNERIDTDEQANRKMLLEEYKVFVDTMEKAIARRQIANSFFLTANSILLTAAGLMAKQAFDNTVALAVVIPLAAAGILLCSNWRRLIANYRQLNAAKFDVIHGFEGRLPAAPFKAEWNVLVGDKRSSKYKPISRKEEGVAIAFTVIHSAALAGSIIILIVVYGA
jgi:hypothetical protein